jgi:hypothetical protein
MAEYGDGTSLGTPTLAENRVTKRAKTQNTLMTHLFNEITPLAEVYHYHVL